MRLCGHCSTTEPHPSRAFFYSILPQSIPNLLSYTFYRLECSIRSAAVLGVIGAGGLGYQLWLSFQSLRYNEMWTFIFALIVLSGAVDIWSSQLRRRFGGSSRLETANCQSPSLNTKPVYQRDRTGNSLANPGRDPDPALVLVCEGGFQHAVCATHREIVRGCDKRRISASVGCHVDKSALASNHSDVCHFHFSHYHSCDRRHIIFFSSRAKSSHAHWSINPRIIDQTC